MWNTGYNTAKATDDGQDIRNLERDLHILVTPVCANIWKAYNK